MYRCGADGAPAFVEVDAPTDDALYALLQTAIARLIKMLTRRSVLVEEMRRTYLAEPAELLALLGRSPQEVSSLVISHLH